MTTGDILISIITAISTFNYLRGVFVGMLQVWLRLIGINWRVQRWSLGVNVGVTVSVLVRRYIWEQFCFYFLGLDREFRFDGVLSRHSGFII